MFIKNIWKLISSSLKILIKVCLNIIVAIVFLCAIILVSPIYIFRLFVVILSYFHPDLDAIIGVHSTTFAIDDIYTNPLANINVSTIFQGNINIKEFRKLVMEKVINITKSNRQLKNVTLKQYPYQWMGFMFWRWEENFDLSEHVYCYKPIKENSKLSKEELLILESKLMTKPFTKQKSPWEIILVRNVEWDTEGEHSMILFRIHHSICDGLSFIKNISLTLSVNDGTKLEQFVATPSRTEKQPGLRHYLNALRMLMELPYQTAKYFVEISRDQNGWKNSKTQLENKYLSSLSKRIPMALVKEIKTIHNVEVTTVICAGFAAGIRRAMLKQNGKVPEIIHLMLPFPMVGHPDHLTNHFSTIHLRLPLGETDPVKRLKMIQENFDNLKKTFLPFVPFGLAFLVGSLFPALTRAILKNSIPTCFGSSFPGPKNKCQILDDKAVAVYFSVGSCVNHAPVLVTTMSYSNDLLIKVSVNRGVIDNQLDVDDIHKTIEQEFAQLKNSFKPNIELIPDCTS